MINKIEEIENQQLVYELGNVQVEQRWKNTKHLGSKIKGISKKCFMYVCLTIVFRKNQEVKYNNSLAQH